MLELNSPISEVPKIGPKYQKILEKLEIYRIEDLLYHFPFRYQDFSIIKNINDLKDGDIVTVKAVLGPVQNIYTKNRKRITKAKVLDHTGELDIIWFNQHYIKNTLQTGKTYNISGKVGTFDRKICFISPEMEVTSDVFSKDTVENIHTGRLVPIYPETYGVSSKWIRGKVKTVLDSDNDMEEFLPKEVLEENNYGFNHSVLLAKLDLGTTYVYQIKTKDRWGNEISSERFGIYSGSKLVSVFDLIIKAVDETFSWAIKK